MIALNIFVDVIFISFFISTSIFTVIDTTGFPLLTSPVDQMFINILKHIAKVT